MSLNQQNLLSLYIHWPYCESKCPYCDFNSHVIEKIDEDNWIKSYTNQIYEFKSLLDRFEVKYDNLNTIFFGGGTPSLMPLKVLDHILNISSKVFKFKDGIESETFLESYSINSTYDYEKIISLFRNFDTMSFLDLILNELILSKGKKLFLKLSIIDEMYL